MRVTYDPEKRERTLKQRGLDFEDAKFVFSGVNLEIEDTRGTTVKLESSATATLPVVLWLSGTHRVARFATYSA